jgi:hypothetical protein
MAKKPSLKFKFSSEVRKELQRRLKAAEINQPIVMGVTQQELEKDKEEAVRLAKEAIARSSSSDELEACQRRLDECDAALRKFFEFVRDARRLKVRKLLKCYGMGKNMEITKEPSEWEILAYVLAGQLYDGFAVVKVTNSKNRKWSDIDKGVLVSRVQTQLSLVKSLKAAIGRVIKNFPDDYGKFDDKTITSRYHEFVAAGCKPISVLELLMMSAPREPEQNEEEVEPVDLASIPTLTDTKH